MIHHIAAPHTAHKLSQPVAQFHRHRPPAEISLYKQYLMRYRQRLYDSVTTHTLVRHMLENISPFDILARENRYKLFVGTDRLCRQTHRMDRVAQQMTRKTRILLFIIPVPCVTMQIRRYMGGWGCSMAINADGPI